ncbi:hypothetical protein ABZ805_08470 [Saccharopolyspora sp. NPDC047091]|uniref:hypothetical protein n=1 Tax=Saccharopolyspora sp. NPDC047091 TaxID=3155924 RepID=UPI0033D3BCA1
MRCGIALYEIRNPDSRCAYEQLICLGELPGDDQPAVWRDCLTAWGLAQLRAHDCRFGRYFAAVLPLDEEGAPDDAAADLLLEQDVPPAERHFAWSGYEELVPA